MNYKTRLDEDDGFGQIVPLCREYTLLEQAHNPELSQQFLEEQLLDQSLKFRWPGTDILCYGFQRKESVRGWSPYSQRRTQIQCRINHWTSQSRERRILFGTVEIWYPGDCHTSNKETCADSLSVLPGQASFFSRKEPFPRPRGSGKLFLLIHHTKEDLLQQRSPKWSQGWCVIMIKKTDNLMQHFIGTRQGRNCWERSRTEEHKIFLRNR